MLFDIQRPESIHASREIFSAEKDNPVVRELERGGSSTKGCHRRGEYLQNVNDDRNNEHEIHRGQYSEDPPQVEASDADLSPLAFLADQQRRD